MRKRDGATWNREQHIITRKKSASLTNKQYDSIKRINNFFKYITMREWDLKTETKEERRCVITKNE